MIECNGCLQDSELTLRSVLGTTIRKIKTNGSKGIIDVESIENGVYFLSIMLEQGFSEQKIIIQH